MANLKSLKNKKISVCVTIFNESLESINKLLNALSNQSLKADEVIIVDATKVNNYQTSIIKQYKKLNLKFINRFGTSRAKGRNIAVNKAKNEIIAITDAGCLPHKDWLEEISKPFSSVSSRHGLTAIVVAGGYEMVTSNHFQEACKTFLGTKKEDIDSNFMPSARSMAFTKTIWKKAGRFPENLDDTAEDTVFNLNLLRSGAKFVVAKNAVVDWYMPTSIKGFYLKIKNYAKGDAQSCVWWHPVKKWKTHNIKVLSIFLRYLVLIAAYLTSQPLFWLLAVGYLLFAFMKAGFWGIYLQFISDFACMVGFLSGVSRAKSTSG